MFGGKPARGQPKPPPPPVWRPDLATPPRGERPNLVTKTPKWTARMRLPSGGGGGGNSPTFQITQQWNNISRCLFHTKVCIPYPLLIAVSKFAHLLSTWRKEKSGTYYSETEPINRRQIWSPGLSRLHSILQATSLRRTVYTRTKSATTTHVPLKLLLHKVYISNILCGLRLWVQDIYKRSLSLAMFISTS